MISNMNIKQRIDRMLHKYVYKITERVYLNNIINLECQISNIAAKETAEYILKNMPKVRSFKTIPEFFKHAVNSADKEGDILEFGVYKGDTINLISSFTNKTVIGFDSFVGFPEDWRTGYEKDVFNLGGKLPKVNSNVRLIKGWFEEGIKEYLKKANNEKISFIHMDGDLYSSAKTVLDLLGHKIKSGTIILFDDYFNHANWKQGEFKAFQEFVKKNKIKYEYIGYLHRNGGAVTVRIL